MRNCAQLAKYGRLTGCPARDHSSSVGIRVSGVPARQTTECRLVGPVLLIDVAALRALPAGVLRVDVDHGNAGKRGFVGDKRSQLEECPTVENYSLLAPANRIHAIPNSPQVFEFDSAFCAFSASNDLLTYNVVRVSGKTRFLAGQLFQAALRRACLLLLEFGSQPPLAVSNRFHLAAAVPPAVRVRSDVDDTEVNTQKLLTHAQARFRGLARRVEVERSATVDQIGLAPLSGEQALLRLSADERDANAPADSPDRNRRGLKAQDARVVGDSAVSPKGPLGLVVELVGVRDLRDTTHRDLSGQPKALARRPVAEFVQVELAECLRGPSAFTDVIGRGVGHFQSAPQKSGLLCRRLQFKLCCQLQSGYLLRFDVSPNGRSGHRACAANVIAPTPKRRQPRFQKREFLPQLVACVPLHLVGNVLRRVGRWGLQKKVNVVGHHFEGDNFAVEFGRLRHDQAAQCRFDRASQYFRRYFGHQTKW
jgi:hypothetical protein